MTDWAAFAGFTGLVLAVLLSLAHFSRGVPHAEGTGSDALDAPAAPGDGASDSDSRATAADDSVPTAAESDETDWSAELDTVSLASFSVDSTGASPRPEPSTPAEADVVGDAHADVDAGPESDSDRATPPGVTAAPVSAVSERSASAEDLPPHLLLANVALSQAFFGGFLGLGAWYAGVPAAALGLSAADLPTQLAVGVGLGLALYGANRVGSTVSERFGVAPDEAVRESLTPRTTAGWVFLFAVALPLIAGFEELLFRGALVGAVAAGFDVSPWLMAAVSSAAFGAGHGAQGRLGIIVTGLLGFVLAAAFVLTESLLVVVVAHYLVNALEFAGHELFGW
ncbi:CPBP family intramembrane glutamic endopeptidase [Haloferax volcanii]|uniref:Abi/CAAX domain protein n=3 Tax=Haloferax volcanii TaxID=2246 RepID=D4GU09_HALVD|nr:CPBP family intramembrane glutamic endopeptidase [Haloferax volcanii]ADE02519.1 Abi/CAAX domain protein [Haloferax volcanii DS2]ELY26353.1 putative CAAX amino terminal protease family protein [Haloferax volcanii DS2]MBS8120203.1 CPBP family intramembrane metalloprotease [Haloferax volcanii]MBS8125241.1 CPBP family intramembrane metalloprotease [Haloferax volcanii]MBS8129109.1 CPBP family intramembrane metalloprotease [Haloferax volcanii]